MAEIISVGVEALDKLLDKISRAGGAIAKMSVYDGAGVVADAIREEIMALPTEKPRLLKEGERMHVIVEDDKQDMADGLGISTIETKAGKTRAVIGFAGYTRHRTKKYKNGVPIQMIARSIESGSSVREKDPFIRRAVERSKDEAKQAMIRRAEKQIEETIGKE